MKEIYKYCTHCKTEWRFIPKEAELKNEGKPTDGFYFKCRCKDELFLNLHDALALAGRANNLTLLDRVKRSFL